MNLSAAKKRKTDTPTAGDPATPEKENKEDSEKGETEESTTTESPSSKDKVPLAEGENPTESKLPEGQVTPVAPKQRGPGRPPRKDKDKDTPTSSVKKGWKSHIWRV